MPSKSKYLPLGTKVRFMRGHELVRKKKAHVNTWEHRKPSDDTVLEGVVVGMRTLSNGFTETWMEDDDYPYRGKMRVITEYRNTRTFPVYIIATSLTAKHVRIKAEEVVAVEP